MSLLKESMYGGFGAEMLRNDITKLKESIKHCKEVQSKSCTNNECKRDHKQLELWLAELLNIKKQQLAHLTYIKK